MVGFDNHGDAQMPATDTTLAVLELMNSRHQGKERRKEEKEGCYTREVYKYIYGRMRGVILLERTMKLASQAQSISQNVVLTNQIA